MPIEGSGQEWFAPEYGDRWLEHVQRIGPDYAKVLVRDHPRLPKSDRQTQLERLAEVSQGLEQAGIPLLYELLVPATDDELARVDGTPSGRNRRRTRLGPCSRPGIDSYARSILSVARSSVLGMSALQVAEPPEGAADPVVRSLDDVLATLATVVAGDGPVPDADRIDRIATLERLRGAVAAAQAAECVRFAQSQVEAQLAADVHPG